MIAQPETTRNSKVPPTHLRTFATAFIAPVSQP